MIRLSEIESWWSRHDGRFEALDDVLPYVVVHRAPQAGDWSLRPLVIGAHCYQAKLIGSLDVLTFEKALSRMPNGYDAAVLRRHEDATRAWRPVIEHGRFQSQELTGTHIPRIAPHTQAPQGRKLYLCDTDSSKSPFRT